MQTSLFLAYFHPNFRCFCRISLSSERLTDRFTAESKEKQSSNPVILRHKWTSRNRICKTNITQSGVINVDFEYLSLLLMPKYYILTRYQANQFTLYSAAHHKQVILYLQYHRPIFAHLFYSAPICVKHLIPSWCAAYYNLICRNIHAQKVSHLIMIRFKAFPTYRVINGNREDAKLRTKGFALNLTTHKKNAQKSRKRRAHLSSGKSVGSKQSWSHKTHSELFVIFVNPLLYSYPFIRHFATLYNFFRFFKITY